MPPAPFSGSILTLNGGSSSIKFAVYRTGQGLDQILSGKLDRVGLNGTTLSWRCKGEDEAEGHHDLPDGTDSADHLFEWLRSRPEMIDIAAVGHRIVHGLERTEPVLVSTSVIEELRRARPFAPEHMPLEIHLIERLLATQPHLPQVCCFDTAFHARMPKVATVLPIPRRYYAKGVRRYGFHGLSYAYLLEELGRIAGGDAARGRVILAHLGNGSSMAAVHEASSIDTSMAFTPAAGLVMSTRTGDIDPGLVSFLAASESMTPAAFHEMATHESGLLGVSETSSDMRDLLAREKNDPRAAEAVALFCYQARKWIGAFTAALGGLDTLVFSAGIGEGSAPIRARICEGLGFLGLELDHARNARHEPLVSTDRSRVAVRVMVTNEELMIARSVARVLAPGTRHTEAGA